MQIQQDFLAEIIPQHGIVCLATERSHPVNGHGPQPWTHHFFTLDGNASAVFDTVEEWNRDKDTNIYFAIANYKSAGERKRNNVATIQTLLLDVDLWASVKNKQKKKKANFYQTKKEVLEGLQRLLKAVPGLPKPWVIDSGNGIHVYFQLDTPLRIDQWRPLAEHFVRVIRKVEPKLVADPTRTRDATSVMRVPGSYNAKSKNPVPTKLVVRGKAGTVQQVKDALSAVVHPSEQNAVSPDALGLGAAPSYAQSDEPNRLGGTPLLNLPLRPILAGCKQMRSIAHLKGNVPEPEWVLALRVFATVKLPEKAALVFSKGHPRFSARETLRKLDHIRKNFEAPSAGCVEFEDCQPERCKGCAYKGKVWSPSQIPQLHQVEAAELEQEAQTVEKVKQQVETLPPTMDVTLPMPSYYEQAVTESGEEVTLLPVKNKNDPHDTRALIRGHITVKRGSVLTYEQLNAHGKVETRQRDLRVHLQVTSQGRTIPLTVPAVDLSADRLETATKALRDVGVLITAEYPEEQRAVRKFLRQIVTVTSLGKPLPHRPDKGWSVGKPLGKRSLTLGARRWDHKGQIEEGCTKGQHLGDDTETFIEAFCSGQPRGTLAKWQQGMEVYNHPNMELTQMLLLSGVANMLLPVVSNQKGGLLLALTGRSGAGKTTLLRFMGSFIGDPGRCMIPGSSTPNALVNMLKQSQFFMLPVDDTLNLDAAQLTLLLSAVSSGMERMRLTGGTSQDAYTANWADPFYSSLLITSNYSMDAVIGTGDANMPQLQFDAARSRLLEVPADVIRLNTVGADKWYAAEALIAANYGHAVVAMADYLSRHQTQIGQLANDMRVKLEKELIATSPAEQQPLARFWARYIACVSITAVILCDRLGILPWDAKAIRQRAVEFVSGIHVSSMAHRSEVAENIWDVLVDNKQGMIAINYSYYRATVDPTARDQWPEWDEEGPSAGQRRRRLSQWDSDAAGAMLLSNLNIGAPPNVSNVLGRPHSWRVILTTVCDKDGKVIRIERWVDISLTKLRSLVAKHRDIRATSWEEAYYDLTISGCQVRGVNPSSPSHWGRGAEQVRGYIDMTRESKGVMKAVVRIIFPPLPPDVLEAD